MDKRANKKLIKPIVYSQHGQQKKMSEQQVLEQLRQLANSNPLLALSESNKIQANNPQAEKVRAFYYQSLIDLELKQELITATEQKLGKQPRDKLALSYKAHALRLLGQVEAASLILEKLLKLSPNDSQALNSLATAVKELGDFGRADQLLERALIIQPNYGKAYWNRSDISTTPEKDLAQINKLLETGQVPKEEQHYLHFSAYRMFEKEGQPEKAFHHLQQGNRLKLKSLGYSVNHDLQIDADIRNTFTNHFFDTHQPFKGPSISPIFIFGMPRSGTTLVEQIIASHSMVQGGNELSALGDATREVQRRYRLNGAFPKWLTQLPNSGWGEIGAVYDRLTEPLKGDKSYLTDKALLNYKTIGLIKMCLPNAKLIQVDRNPMDVCFGCYRQLFSNGLKFSYSFEDLAKTYASYQQMMDHWHRVLPGFVLKIKYEDLVVNPEIQIKSILNFCGLEPEQACFEPHKTRRTVRTLSATQVREPIFKSGVNRWLSYADQLEPLKALLSEHDISIN